MRHAQPDGLLTIAVAQCPCGDLGIYDQLLRVRRHMERAARRGAALMVFPELTNAPYFPARQRRAPRAHVEPVPGPFVNNVAAMAREFGLAVVVSVAEAAGAGKPYLSAVLIDARGKIAGIYHKTHLPQFPAAREQDCFRAGKELKPLRAAGLKAGLLLCYDRHFPEAARAHALQGADLLIIPSATPQGAAGTWLCELQALACTNGVFVVAANRCGEEGDLRFLGRSCIIGPQGKVLAQAEEQEQLLLATVDAADLRTAPGRNWRRDRQPRLYAALAKGKR